MIPTFTNHCDDTRTIFLFPLYSLFLLHTKSASIYIFYKYEQQQNAYKYVCVLLTLVCNFFSVKKTRNTFHNIYIISTQRLVHVICMYVYLIFYCALYSFILEWWWYWWWKTRWHALRLAFVSIISLLPLFTSCRVSAREYEIEKCSNNNACTTTTTATFVTKQISELQKKLVFVLSLMLYYSFVLFYTQPDSGIPEERIPAVVVERESMLKQRAIRYKNEKYAFCSKGGQ